MDHPHKTFCRMCGTEFTIASGCETWTRIPLGQYLLAVWRELLWRFKWAVGWRPKPLRIDCGLLRPWVGTVEYREDQ